MLTGLFFPHFTVLSFPHFCGFENFQNKLQGKKEQTDFQLMNESESPGSSFPEIGEIN